MIYYSTSTKGFYDSTISTSIPEDAKEITDELHADLMDKQTLVGGKIVFPEDGGLPSFDPYVIDVNEQLRDHRNNLLADTDWMAGQDAPTMSQDWKDYRQALRDLPSSESPKIDDDGSLINVTWPTKPE